MKEIDSSDPLEGPVMKRVLLIAGGGTLGTYTAEELLRLGHMVDVIVLKTKFPIMPIYGISRQMPRLNTSKPC